MKRTIILRGTSRRRKQLTRVVVVLPSVALVTMAVGYALGAHSVPDHPEPEIVVQEIVLDWEPDGLLPDVGADLPPVGSEAFRTRVRKLGLDPQDVEMFAEMMRREGLQVAAKN
jgi:hypothetical protein